MRAATLLRSGAPCAWRLRARRAGSAAAPRLQCAAAAPPAAAEDADADADGGAPVADGAPYTLESMPPEGWPAGLTTPRRRLGLRGAALGLLRLPPGEGAPRLHRHAHQEEVYVVLSGAGEAALGEERVPLVRALRIARSPRWCDRRR
jgi:hypothetical protein